MVDNDNGKENCRRLLLLLLLHYWRRSQSFRGSTERQPTEDWAPPPFQLRLPAGKGGKKGQSADRRRRRRRRRQQRRHIIEYCVPTTGRC